MKKLLILAFLFMSVALNATNYYVKNGGNDNNTGLSDAQAWATLAKVNNSFSGLSAGDQILFNRGDTFYGTIRISKSGTSVNPIIIGAYGSGADPIITGFTTLSGWTNEGANIYSKVITSEAQTNMVTVNGIPKGMGRYPDSTYNIFESFNDDVSITDNGLGDSPDWAGAELVLRKCAFTLDRLPITDHTGDVLTYSGGIYDPLNPRFVGYGYFIQNDLRCVTTTNEWYHDYAGTGKFYIYGNPAAKIVKVATIKNLLYNNGYDFITVNNISFIGSISDGLYFNTSSDHCTIQNCRIEFAGQDGIKLYGSYNTIDNNNINHSSEAGIYSNDYAMMHSNNKITNNVINGSGLIAGAALNGNYLMGIYLDRQTNGLIQYNSIDSSGFIGIYFNYDNHIVKNNFVNHSAVTLDDGAGIYTSGVSSTGRVIEGNIVLNTYGNSHGTPFYPTVRSAGIYADYNAAHVTVKNNTVANGYMGLFANYGSYNTFENNTVFNSSQGITVVNPFKNNFSNNILFEKDATQFALALYYYSPVHGINEFGSANYNYYARPIDDNETFLKYESSTFDYKSFTEWQIYSGQDANSHTSPIRITDASKIDFYYNATKANKVIALVKPMIDVKGSKYANSITLLPFTSVILMVDPNPAKPDIPVYLSSVIENVTPALLTMKYSLTLANVVPAASAFSVSVNSKARTVNSVVVSGTSVELTLASPVVYGDAVNVSYTKPSGNYIQTVSGGMAASIVSQPVTNNCVNVAPVVEITSPNNNTILTSPANFTIIAVASDPDGSLTMVEFYNGNTKLGSASAAPYSFTFNNVGAGIYSLTAVATDDHNAKTKSSAILITVTSGPVSVNQYPSVMITNPAKGDKYENPGTIDIEVVASDPDGTISKVELYNGSTKLAELSSAPYLYSWKDVDTGTYSIKAVAYDNLNATTTSSLIEFTVVDNSSYDAGSEIINLYPNPNDGHFSIEFIVPLQNEKSKLVVADLAGTQVYNSFVSKEETIKQIDLSYIKSGIYILMIIYREMLVTKKIIKY